MRFPAFLLCTAVASGAAAEERPHRVLVHLGDATGGSFRMLPTVDAEFATALGPGELGARAFVVPGGSRLGYGGFLVGRGNLGRGGFAWFFGELALGAGSVEISNGELSVTSPLAFAASAAAGACLDYGPVSTEIALTVAAFSHTTTTFASELGLPPERDRWQVFTGVRIGFGVGF